MLYQDIFPAEKYLTKYHNTLVALRYAYSLLPRNDTRCWNESVSTGLRLTVPFSNNAATAAGCPFQAAECNGVSPSLFWE